MSKHKIFLSDSCERLLNEELIGEADTYAEAYNLIRKTVQSRGIIWEPYDRILIGSTATFIDFGSWCKFAAIVPPIPKEVITGGSKND